MEVPGFLLIKQISGLQVINIFHLLLVMGLSIRIYFITFTQRQRPGNYPEEPMGPKGIVNRWADWMIKDLTKDWRGDYYFFMGIPYGKIMVLTTDRPDMWIKIDQMYKTITP